jgi:hypothetical protein
VGGVELSDATPTGRATHSMITVFNEYQVLVSGKRSNPRWARKPKQRNLLKINRADIRVSSAPSINTLFDRDISEYGRIGMARRLDAVRPHREERPVAPSPNSRVTLSSLTGSSPGSYRL